MPSWQKLSILFLSQGRSDLGKYYQEEELEVSLPHIPSPSTVWLTVTLNRETGKFAYRDLLSIKIAWIFARFVLSVTVLLLNE